MNHIAVLQVSAELLIEKLHLPADVNVVDARIDFQTRAIELVIEHPSLPATAPSMIIPRVRATFLTHMSEGVRTVEFVGFRP